MTDSLLWQLARTFGAVSMIAIGGANAVVPAIRHEVVDVLRWMDDATFMHLFAIAQAAPGPNVLVASLIGWHMAGFAGLMVATLAMVAPPCLLAWALGRWMAGVSGTAGFRLAQDALVPLAVGLIIASGLDMARASYAGLSTVAITAGAAAWIFFTRINPIWPLAAAAVAGWLLR